jgi:hypothetical protein
MAAGQHRALGAILISMPGQAQVEIETHTCQHCNGIVETKGPGVDPGKTSGWCGNCFAIICIRCATNGRCTPFERKLERVESRARFLESIGLG